MTMAYSQFLSTTGEHGRSVGKLAIEFVIKTARARRERHKQRRHSSKFKRTRPKHSRRYVVKSKRRAASAHRS